MARDKEKLYEGTYLYYRDGQNYSQENFTVESLTEPLGYLYHSEILSRVDTGEFFKMLVSYEVNKFYVPQSVVMEKSLGEKYAKESYSFDVNNQILRYTFKTENTENTVERPFGAKHYIAAPSFLTSCLFTLTRKIDTTTRTPVVFITAANSWDFIGMPEDKVLYTELKTHDADDISIGGAPLTASKFAMFDQNSQTGVNTPIAHFWVSKHLGIPYQMEDVNGIRITVKRLKRLQNEIEKI